MKTISQYCQKCASPNEPGESNCRVCGTRLMIVVFPPAMRHDESIVPSYYEDHLLERVSLLELRLAQVNEQLKMAYDFITREAKSFQKDHQLLQAFFESIEKLNPDLSQDISKNCLEIWDEKRVKAAVENKNEQLLQSIFKAHGSKQAELFTHLINEGIKRLHENEEKQAFLTLERATLLSPSNIPLLIFVAESYLRADRFEEAKSKLERASEIAPRNEKVLLMLGAVLADEAEAEEARKFLSVPANNPKFSVGVNFIWGMLAAFEKNWTESLAAFKEALNQQENPELLYLIGCVYFQLGQTENALDYFEKTVRNESKFADSWFMQSVIYNDLGDAENAGIKRQTALETREAGAQCLEFLRKTQSPKLDTALPFLHFEDGKRILSKGSLRLTKFFRRLVLSSSE